MISAAVMIADSSPKLFETLYHPMACGDWAERQAMTLYEFCDMFGIAKMAA